MRSEHHRLERMQIYRAVTDEAMQGCAEEEPLGQLLAQATALARGGEIGQALEVAKVVGVISRAAKNNALLHPTSAPFVQFVQQNEKNAHEVAIISVSASAARASLSKLIDNALQGDTIILERSGRRVAKIVPYTQQDFVNELEARFPPVKHTAPSMGRRSSAARPEGVIAVRCANSLMWPAAKGGAITPSGRFASSSPIEGAVR